MYKVGFWSYYKEEVKVIRDRDPAIKKDIEAILYPSFWAIYNYRRAHKLYERGKVFKARRISQRTARKTGIEIHPGAKIVIGETAILGDNITLYQGVTLGGTGKEQGKRHPTLEDNVLVGAGAKVLGSFTIGRNSKIAAGSVVLEEVPPYSTVVGVPGIVVKRNDEAVPCYDLDQVHIPHPVQNELKRLSDENTKLREMIDQINNKIKE